MKRFKKLAALFLALAMCFTMLSSTVSAQGFDEGHIAYHGNGNTGGSAPGNTTFTWTTVDGDLDLWAKTSTQGSLVKTGYTFAGWNTQANGSGTGYSANQWIVGQRTGFIVYYYYDTHLYAQWTPTPYTVTFDAHNSTTNTQAVGSIVSAVSAPSDPSKTGYTFAGWYTGANGTGSAITFPYTPTAAITLHANWSLNVYDVTFDAHNGTPTIGVSGSIESAVTEPSEPSKTGYTFDDWYTGANGTGSAVSFPYVPTAATTLHANWTLNVYEVTFDAHNCTPTIGVSGSIESAVTKPSDPSKTGYTFAGWYTGANGTGSAVSFPYVPTAATTLHANWTINQYTMTFNTAGGSAVAPITQNYMTQIAKPSDPTRAHYTFAGWVDSNNNPIVFPYTITNDITIVAKWNINVYTVVFDSDNGSNVTPVKQNYNTQVTKPSDPTKYGYTFSGWYTNAYGIGTPISFPFTLIGNTTIYAKWTAGQYTLSFNTDGGSSIASVSGNFASFISSIETPTKAGYTFDGWYTGAGGTGSKISFPYQIAGNATAYAKWIKVAATSDVSVPAVSSAPVTPSTTSTPPSASVPQMGAQGTASFAITGIALFMLLISGLAVMTSFKMRKKESK